MALYCIYRKVICGHVQFKSVLFKVNCTFHVQLPVVRAFLPASENNETPPLLFHPSFDLPPWSPKNDKTVLKNEQQFRK